MTSPWGNPPPLPHPPRELITVPVSACCELMPGDVCDCQAWQAEVLAAFTNPYAPPLLWQVSGDVVSVEVKP